MDKEILKINLLAIAGSGFLMLTMGILLYIFRERISPYMRFLLPIPPLGVAAYIFVFNMFKYYNGNIPGKRWDVVSEVAYGTLIAAILFGLFTALLIVGVHYLKKYL